MACPAIQYFPTISHRRHDFRKKITEHHICFDFLYKFLYETFLVLRRTERGMMNGVSLSSCKVPVVSVLDFNKT